ncbi:hypothetical protein J2T08_006142 [Neorhizobium galegae]|nr:hypothetical protein [Neorhizobium galegae]MDQ0138197.1 hypothetical protein [Neorhizobium galegae]
MLCGFISGFRSACEWSRICWAKDRSSSDHLIVDPTDGTVAAAAKFTMPENLQPEEPLPDMDVSEPVRDPDTGHMILSVVAAALCIKPRGRLTDRQAGKVNALKQGSTVFAIMRGLAMRFNGILRNRSSEALDE